MFALFSKRKNTAVTMRTAGREPTADELKKKRGEGAARVLEWTLIDSMEDLADLHFNVSSSQQTRLKGSAEQKRYEAVQRSLAGLTIALERRRVERQMMRPPKRRVLNKLLVLRALLGDDFTYSVARPDWVIPEPEAHERKDHPNGADSKAEGKHSGTGSGAIGIGGSGGGGGGAYGLSASAGLASGSVKPFGSGQHKSPDPISDAAKLRVEAEDRVGQLTPAPAMHMPRPSSAGAGDSGLALGSVRTRRATSRTDREDRDYGMPLGRQTSFTNRASVGTGPVSASGGLGAGAASGNLARRSKTFTGTPTPVIIPQAGSTGGGGGSPAADDPNLPGGARFSAATASPGPGAIPSTPSGVSVAIRPTPAINRPIGRGLSARNMRIDTGRSSGTLSPAVAGVVRDARPVTPPAAISEAAPGGELKTPDPNGGAA